MAYKLTLTIGERKAMDFVGNRYPEGDDFYKLLSRCGHPVDWDADCDATYEIPEHIAWEIRDLLTSEDCNYGAALFASHFRRKLMDFCDNIV